MVALSALVLAGSILGSVLAVPTSGSGSELHKRQERVKQGEGIGPDGFFYTVWDDGNMQQTFTNQANGAFDLSWSGNGDVVAGKGWKEGSDRNITYSGTYETGGMSFLMIYGWFENPLVEYYVMENWDEKSDPSKDTDMQYITTLNTDGSDYDVYKKTQVNWPSIIGKATFAQYRSVRKNGGRTSGTVHMGAHFDAWRGAGLVLNEGHYQVVAVEGMQTGSSGKASITVSQENSAPAPPPEPAPSPSPAPSPAPAPSSSSAPPPPPPPPSSSAAAPVPAPPVTSVEAPAPETTAPAPGPEPSPTTSEVAPAPPAPTQTQPATPSAPVNPPASSSSAASPTRSWGGWWRKQRKSRKGRTSAVVPEPTTPPQAAEAGVAVTTTVKFVTVYETVSPSA